MTAVATRPLVRATSLAELRASGRLVVHVDGHTLCLFADGDEVYAVDNRCPHMGFPLHRGTLCDGILTCHWHHARFDLSTGGTFDQWADDLRRFPVEVRGDDVLVDFSPLDDMAGHHRKRLHDGLEREIPLVLAKAALALTKADPAGVETFCAGLDFGVARRGGGWFRGLTTLTCLMNLLPRLDEADRPAALYHGLADVAADSAGEPPHFRARPAPGTGRPIAACALVPRLHRGPGSRRRGARARLRRAGRRLTSSSRTCSSQPRPTTVTWTAGTRSTSSTRRWKRSMSPAGNARRWCSLRCQPSSPARNGWRRQTRGGIQSISSRCSTTRSRNYLTRFRRAHPLAAGWGVKLSWTMCSARIRRRASMRCSTALRDGASEVELASAVSFAAVIRIARFPTSNEFGDWDTALHTFTFANAVEQGLRRSPSPELLRGVFDAAMSIHLDRFLNVPPAKVPAPDPGADRDLLLEELPRLLDRQQQVAEAGQLVASFLGAGGDPPGSSPRSAPRSCVRTATSTRSSASKRPYASTRCSLPERPRAYR